MLTDNTIQGLKRKVTDYWKADSDSKGRANNLYLRVRSSGAKTWHVRRLKDGVLLNKRIGQWPTMSLKAARQMTLSVLTGSITDDSSLKAVADEWFEQRIATRYKRPKQVRLYLDRIAPTLLAKPIHEIDRLSVTRFLQGYARDRGPVAANRLLAIMQQLFRYAHKAGYVPDSAIAPLSRSEIGGEEKARERVLTDDELRLLWRDESNHVPLVRFLLLTAQRIGEAQSATWSHVRGDKWTIPAEHSKNGRAHWVSLSPQALAVLRDRPQDRPHLFADTSETAVQAWMRRWCERQKITEAFTPHDLRRTAATRMNDLGVAPHVVEKILNHTMQGVMATYNRAEYVDERTKAMLLWGKELARIMRVKR